MSCDSRAGSCSSSRMWGSTRSSRLAAGKVLGQLLRDDVANILAVEGLRQHLHDEHVVVLVHDQAGQQVGLAEDHAVGIAVANVFLAEAHGIVDPAAQRATEVPLSPMILRGQQPNGDLRRSCCRAPSRACGRAHPGHAPTRRALRHRPSKCRSDRPRDGRTSAAARRGC